MAQIHILKGTNPGERLELKDEKTVFGRNPDCQVVIAGTAVSRAHAHILKNRGKFFIEDLDSRNKTFVNNQELAPRTPVELKENDRIKICDFLCTFHDSAPTKPLPEALRPDDSEAEPPEDPLGSTTVEATVSSVASHVLLETQPAEKLKTLLDITNNLSKTLELDPLLPKIVDSLFQLFRQADRGFIILSDPTAKRLIPKVIKTRRQLDEANARFSRSIVNQCLETVQAFLSDDASSDSKFAMSQSIADFRIRSVMCAPLWAQDGKAFGVMQLDTQDRSKKFTQDDLNILMAVARQASIALENAKLHAEAVSRERLKRDLELAREVQHSFLPLRPPAIPGYEFFTHYESAQEVGGDYFDFIPMPRQRFAVMLGDVAGKGVPAALMMAKISADAKFCMLTEPAPALAINRLNASMHEAGLTDRFITLVAALLDPGAHSVTLINAGHPSPLVYRAATGEMEEATPNEKTGLPIGVLDGQEYDTCQVTLNPGDAVVTFSDGVTDAMDVNNNQFHVKGIYDAVRGKRYAPRALGEQIVKVVTQHAAGRSQHDDLTLVCFGRTKDGAN
jgi:serine phosphatase RsbU (regulator of sigma subunit)/pSer/pThr/pTyr-binding forkhead associated (FHA) protein